MHLAYPLDPSWLDFTGFPSTMLFVMALFGILNINKPRGMTSRDVVDRIKWITQPAKVGHAGTLDPLATGVLVICVGQATRLIRYVQRFPKTYLATFLLGCHSETDDVEGPVVPIVNAPEPTHEELEHLLSQFVGEIQQRPPTHSAVKLAGRRAYELARRGESVELMSRPVRIHELTIRRYEYPELELDIECGSGTYVRALGRDIGIALGTGAVMSALHRSAIGWFRSDDSRGIDDYSTHTMQKYLRPAIDAVNDLPRRSLTDTEVIEIGHGRPIVTSSADNGAGTATQGEELAALDRSGRFIAILYEKRPGQLWPKINFL